MELLEVPSKDALDSWFPGFAWSILLCKRCEGRHLGWKFTPTGDGVPFYALIVEAAKEAGQCGQSAANIQGCWIISVYV